MQEPGKDSYGTRRFTRFASRRKYNRSSYERRSYAKKENIMGTSGRSRARGSSCPAGCGGCAGSRSGEDVRRKASRLQITRDQRAKRRRLGAGRRRRGFQGGLRKV